MTVTTTEEVLQRASFCLKKAGVHQPRSEAELILASLLKTDRLQLLVKSKHELTSGLLAKFQKSIRRRCSGEPLAYIIGEKHFYGYRFKVNKEVLIPRPETELLIERAINWSSAQQSKAQNALKCIDLGTGSGVLSVTLALKIPCIDIWAVDISKEALGQAKLNALEHRVENKITFLQGSYFSALQKIKPRPVFDLVVSNPPYISKSGIDNLPRCIKDHEPLQALFGGEDGLESYRTILRELPAYVHKSSLVLFEIGSDQKNAVEEICLKSKLFATTNWFYDLAGHPRVFEGKIK